jgi:F-type H+-transporting ATPase subunit delta
MLSSKASRRYATALLKQSVEENNLDETVADVEMIDKTFSGSKELELVLGNPVIKKDKKLAILSELFKSAVGKLTWRFILMLSDKDRLALLPGIVSDFSRQYNLHAGILDIQVSSAYELDDKQKRNLVSALEDSTGKKIKPTYIQNPDLRGGLVVRIGDTVIDGSVKHKLEQLQNTLYKTAV